MRDHALSPISGHDSARAYATLTSAFADDPVERWLLPDDAEYAEAFPPFVAAVGGSAFTTSTAWELGDCAAVALWIPPGSEPDAERIGRVLIETVAPEKHADVFAVLEQMDDAHPTFPHWYLPWLGVDAARQGEGLGGRLLADCLEHVDGTRLPVYLETPNPRTIAFYVRHGFAVIGHAQAGECPPLTCMLRDGRGG
jgi:GNAT superfamily N-acetyltransferase